MITKSNMQADIIRDNNSQFHYPHNLQFCHPHDLQFCHPRAGGDPSLLLNWTPAYAGVTGRRRK